MYQELWKPKSSFNPDKPLGSINNPAESNPYSHYPTYYLRKGNEALNYIAIYMGYTKRFTIESDYVPSHDKDGNKTPEWFSGKQYHTIGFIYKQSYSTFEFSDYSWYSYHDVLDTMKEKGDFDQDVQQALITLDQKTLLKAILKKLKSLGIKPNLSLDWKKEMKFVK